VCCRLSSRWGRYAKVFRTKEVRPCKKAADWELRREILRDPVESSRIHICIQSERVREVYVLISSPAPYFLESICFLTMSMI
jgi:hypothetical protein